MHSQTKYIKKLTLVKNYDWPLQKFHMHVHYDAYAMYVGLCFTHSMQHITIVCKLG